MLRLSLFFHSQSTVWEESQATPQGRHRKGSNWRPMASSSMPLPSWTRHPISYARPRLRAIAASDGDALSARMYSDTASARRPRPPKSADLLPVPSKASPLPSPSPSPADSKSARPARHGTCAGLPTRALRYSSSASAAHPARPDLSSSPASSKSTSGCAGAANDARASSCPAVAAAPASGELTGFFPRIDRSFPSSTSKRYSKG